MFAISMDLRGFQEPVLRANKVTRVGLRRAGTFFQNWKSLFISPPLGLTGLQSRLLSLRGGEMVDGKEGGHFLIGVPLEILLGVLLQGERAV